MTAARINTGPAIAHPRASRVCAIQPPCVASACSASIPAVWVKTSATRPSVSRRHPAAVNAAAHNARYSPTSDEQLEAALAGMGSRSAEFHVDGDTREVGLTFADDAAIGLAMGAATDDEKARARKTALYASRTNFILSIPMLLSMGSASHGLPF